MFLVKWASVFEGLKWIPLVQKNDGAEQFLNLSGTSQLFSPLFSYGLSSLVEYAYCSKLATKVPLHLTCALRLQLSQQFQWIRCAHCLPSTSLNCSISFATDANDEKYYLLFAVAVYSCSRETLLASSLPRGARQSLCRDFFLREHEIKLLDLKSDSIKLRQKLSFSTLELGLLRSRETSTTVLLAGLLACASLVTSYESPALLNKMSCSVFQCTVQAPISSDGTTVTPRQSEICSFRNLDKATLRHLPLLYLCELRSQNSVCRSLPKYISVSPRQRSGCKNAHSWNASVDMETNYNAKRWPKM